MQHLNVKIQTRLRESAENRAKWKLGCHCPKQSRAHHHTKPRFWGRRVKVVLPKHLLIFFNSYLKTCVRVCVRVSTHRTHLAGELILRIQLETALHKPFFGRSFASDPSSQRPPGDVDWDWTGRAWKRRERGIAESPAKLSLGRESLAGRRPVGKPSQKPQRDRAKCPPPSVPSRTVLAGSSCLLQPLLLSRHSSWMNLSGGWCSSRCQASFCVAVRLLPKCLSCNSALLSLMLESCPIPKHREQSVACNENAVAMFCPPLFSLS